MEQMMRAIISTCIALALAAQVALAADLKSGPQKGALLGPFEVTKVAGAPNDGVPSGKQLCYRCKLGNQPVVMVFAPKADQGVTTLAKALDQLVAKNKDKNLGSFVNLVGDDSAKLEAQAKQFAEKAKLENVAVVVPVETKDGPEDYKINSQVVTVLIYRDGKVAANHAVMPADLDASMVKSILADTDKILN
jgi:hypothetical protein